MKLKSSSLSSTVLIILGILLVIGSFAGVWYLGRSENRTVQVVVATHAVPPLEPVMTGDVRIEPRPAAAIGKAEAFTKLNAVIGKFVRYGFVPGQILQPAMLASTAAQASNFDVAVTDAAKQHHGVRAVALAVDAQHGFDLPHAHDYVDLIATRSGHPSEAGMVVYHALVLNVLEPGASTASPSGPGGALGNGAPQQQKTAQQGVVVLALTPPQAERLALAQVGGTVTMILEPLGASGKAADIKPITVTALFGSTPAKCGTAAKGGATTKVGTAAKCVAAAQGGAVTTGGK